MDAEEPAAWLFLSPEAVPEVWRGRARPAVFVPLMPGEAKQLLDGESVAATLSPRDESVARLAARGRTAAAIARELGVSRRTVDRRLAVLRDQFGVNSSVELAVRLSARGMALAPGAPTGDGGRRHAESNQRRQQHQAPVQS